MASCQDLVDAVNAINTTLSSIKTDISAIKTNTDKIQVSLCKNESLGDNTGKIAESLDQRQLHRSFQQSFAQDLLDVISLASDNIAAKIDQALYPISGVKCPSTGVPTVDPIDVGLDLDTIHIPADHSSCTSGGGGGTGGGGGSA